MSPVSAAVHAAAAASVHVTASIHWAASVHGSSSGSHVAPHVPAPGGSAQAGDVAATPVEVPAVGEASSEGRGRQEAARWTIEAAAGAGSYEHIRLRRMSFEPADIMVHNISRVAQNNPTSSETASVLETSAAAASLSRAATAKLVLAAPATTAQAATSFWCCASLVGFLFSGQGGLALLFVLLQQLAGLLLLQLTVDDLTEALSLLRQRVEAWNKREHRK